MELKLHSIKEKYSNWTKLIHSSLKVVFMFTKLKILFDKMYT